MTACPVDLELRPMRAEDRNYVLSSWLRSYAGKSRDAREYTDMAAFYADYAPVVRAIVERSTIVVACLKEEPDAVVGWFAVEGDALHYALVKPRWRRLGVATWMLADYAGVSVTVTHETNDSRRCPVPRSWTYRRFRIWPQEKQQ